MHAGVQIRAALIGRSRHLPFAFFVRMHDAEHRMVESVKNGDQHSSETMEQTLWEFVPLSEYSVPSLPARSAVATAWASIAQLFTRRGQDASDFVRDEKELDALGSARLERLFRPVDLPPAAAALDERVSFPAERGAVQYQMAQPSSHTRTIGGGGRINTTPRCCRRRLTQATSFTGLRTGCIDKPSLDNRGFS